MVCSPILAAFALVPFFVFDPRFGQPGVTTKGDAKASSAFLLRTPSSVSDALELKLHGGRTVAPSQSSGHKQVNTSVVTLAGGASPSRSPPAFRLAEQLHVEEHPLSINTTTQGPRMYLEAAGFAADSLGESELSPGGDSNAELHLRVQPFLQWQVAALVAASLGESELSPAGDAKTERRLRQQDRARDTQTPIASTTHHLRGKRYEPQDHNTRTLNILIRLFFFAPFAALLLMIPGGPAANRARLARVPDPPAWGPERESRYPFRHWIQDLLVWGILAVDMDPGQQTAAIIHRLEGEARNVTREMSYAEMTTGGIVNGVAVDPVTYLLAHLAALFAPLGEEARLTAMGELMNFHRHANESIDQLLARFRGIRWRAQQGAGNLTMNWEGYSWLILKACSPNSQQLITILQPFQGRFPSTEAEFDAMTLTLRRMGHVLENTYGNIASQLRTAPTRNFFGWEADGTQSSQQSEFSDPWAGGNDPWSHAYPPAPAAQPVGAYVVPSSGDQQRYDDSGTDTETVSSTGELDYNDPELAAMTPPQQDEHLYWQYQSSKSKWRKHMHKPTRRVRKFFKRKGKGKGKGKGANRFVFLSEMPDAEYDSLFYGGKGKSKGKPRSSGKGKGRRRNPVGRDGQVMRCSQPMADGQVCNSDTHFRAQCPHNPNRQSAGSSFGGFAAPVTDGPLGDLLDDSTRAYMLQETAAPFPSQNAVAADLAIERPPGIWQTPSAVAAPPSVSPVGLFLQPAGAPLFQPPLSIQSPDTAVVANQLNRMTSQDLDTVASLLSAGAFRRLQRSRLAIEGNPVRESGESEASVHNAPRLESMLSQRMAIVQGQLATQVASVTRSSEFLGNQSLELPQLASFQLLSANRERHNRWQTERPTQTAPPVPAWQSLRSHDQLVAAASGPQLPNLTADQVPPSFSPLAAEMMQHQVANLADIRSDRALAQQARARELADRIMTSGIVVAAAAESQHRTGDECQICHDGYLEGDPVARLACSHKFHSYCIDTWVSHINLQNGSRPEGDRPIAGCPLCRAPVDIQIVLAHVVDASVASSASDFQSVGSVLPWWPADTPLELSPTYHASTQLPSGRISLIVDPGAWTNLIGKLLARRLIQRAITAGHKPKQEKIPAIHVAGVGKGQQQCDYKVECPITITSSSNQTSLHKLVAPIVEGPGGEDLPGLLGLRTLEAERAILDTGNRRLYLPGPGAVQIVLPPGSIEVPLEKAPSGHLVMVIDEYEKVLSQKGGVEDVSLTLHSTSPEVNARTVEPDRMYAPADEVRQSDHSQGATPRVAPERALHFAPAATSSGRNFQL